MTSLFFLIVLLYYGEANDAQYSLSCSISKVKVEEPLDFSFRYGYRDAMLSNTNSSQYAKIVRQRETYSAYYDENKNELLDFHFISPSGYWFTAKRFLTLLNNRTLSIIGDSLGLQLFNEIEAELHRIISNKTGKTYNGNGTVEYQEVHNLVPVLPRFPNYNAAMRWYEPYNASIFFCKDNTVEATRYISISEFCTNKAIRLASGGVMIIAVGAWYKPEDDVSNNYPEDLQKSIKRYTENMYNFRRYIKSLQTRPSQIIWRLNAHTGPIDEYNVAYRQGHEFVHGDGDYWDVHDYEAQWPLHFNQVLRGIARHFGDYVLDHYTVSKKLLKLSRDLDMIAANTTTMSTNATLSLLPKIQDPHVHLRVHADSLHYCAGGMFRAAHIVLFELIAHYKRCHKHIYHSKQKIA